MTEGDDFWRAITQLVQESEIVIDRPKGTAHPKYGDLIYPLDYGYLKDTTAPDGGGIDVWRGSDARQTVNAILCTVDLMKRDTEIKVLIGCTTAEIRIIATFHCRTPSMKSILIQPTVNG